MLHFVLYKQNPFAQNFNFLVWFGWWAKTSSFRKQTARYTWRCFFVLWTVLSTV